MAIGPPLSKFKPEIWKKIIADIGDCIPYKIAAESHGVADSTFYDWITKGMYDIKHGIKSDYVLLVEALRETEKKKIKAYTAKIAKGKYGHKGSEWLLEKIFWKHFSSSTSVIDFNERLEKLEAQDKSKDDINNGK